MISLKAPINRDDVSVIYLRYQPDSLQVTYKLPVIVSGSKTNDRDYSVRIDVDNDTGEATGLYLKKGRLVLTAENPALEFEVIGEPTYEIREELDIDRPHIIKRFFTLTMDYKYKDATSSENMVFPYHCSGSMLMQRNVSTLIPDEDQAIFW